MLYLTQTSVNPGLGSTGVSPVVSPGVSPVSTIAPMTVNPCTTSLAFTPGGGNTALTLNTVPQGSTMAPGSIMHLINYGDKDLGLLLSQRFMAGVELAEDTGKSISNCRFRVREFNNKIKDAQLGHIYDDVPCKYCEKSILKEACELNKECGRLVEHYYKDDISPSQISKVCCDTSSKEDTDNASQDNTCIKKVMSKTRKRIRQYNDHLDDLNYKDRDGRPCKTCRERILRECQGLVEELQRANNQFQESNMKNKCPCDYGIEFEDMHVELRGGKKGMRGEPTESLDDNQTASADTTQPKHLNTDTHTVAPSCSWDKADFKGQCVTLEVSMDDSNTTDA